MHSHLPWNRVWPVRLSTHTLWDYVHAPCETICTHTPWDYVHASRETIVHASRETRYMHPVRLCTRIQVQHLSLNYILFSPSTHPLSDSLHSRSARIPSWHGCPSSETAVWRELRKIQSWKLWHRLGLQCHLCWNSTGTHSNSNVLDTCPMEG